MRQTFTEAETEMIQRCISNDPYFRVTEGSLGLAVHIIRKLAMNQDAEPEPFEKAIVELAECAKASMQGAQAERRRYALLQASARLFAISGGQLLDSVRSARLILGQIEGYEEEDEHG